jgi:hypothetical protein
VVLSLPAGRYDIMLCVVFMFSNFSIGFWTTKTKVF